MNATSHIFNRATWRVVVLLCLIAVFLAPPAFAQHHDTAARAGLQSLTVARHADTPFTLADAQGAMTNANTVIQTCNGTPTANEDVACQVTMQVAGGLGTFGTTGDGGDIITTNAQMTARINSGAADVMLVTMISACGGQVNASIIGCGNVGAQGIVSENLASLGEPLLGIEIAHEFLHNQGRNHRGDPGEGPMTPGAILNPTIGPNSNIINTVECGNFHTGASFNAADNGPIVEPPPIITCPAGITPECTSPAGTPKTDAQIAAFLAAATATDGCEPTPTITNNAPSVFPKGTTAVIFTATAVDFLGATSTCQANVQVVDTTRPSITCPAPITVECSQQGGTPASNPAIAAFLAGASATDICDPSPTISNDAPAVFSPGTTSVTFSATDADGNVGRCSADVKVADTTPPVISALSVSPTVLLPPDHRLVPIIVSVAASDICDPNPVCKIASVTSNEPVNDGGDGNTAPDWVITADLKADLRAERSGTGTGRVYTTTVQCSDFSGNSSSKTTAVNVPHDLKP